jgi:hypothetical protein
VRCERWRGLIFFWTDRFLRILAPPPSSSILRNAFFLVRTESSDWVDVSGNERLINMDDALLAALSVARAILGDVNAKSICDKFTMDIDTQAIVSQRLCGGELICHSTTHGTILVPSVVVGELTKSETSEGAPLQIKALRTTNGKCELRAIEARIQNVGGSDWQSTRPTKSKKNGKQNNPAASKGR